MHWPRTRILNNRSAQAPSLAWRLGVGFAVAFLLMAAVYASVQLLLAQRFSGFVTQMSMEGQSEDILEGLQFDGDGRVVGVSLTGIDEYAYDAFFANLKFRVIDVDGRVVASSEPSHDSLLPDVSLLNQHGFYAVRKIGDVDFHVAAWRHTVNGQVLTVQLGRSDRFAELAREAIAPAVTETVGLLATLSALVFSAVGVVAVRSVLQPIATSAQAAARVGRNNLMERLPEAGVPAEIRPLITAFNAVLDRLQLAFDEQQRFFANAAHELKTPLALLRGQLEAGVKADRQALLDDIDAMGRMVHQLLQLAEAADRQNLRHKQLNIASPLDSAVRYLWWKAEKQQVTVQFVNHTKGLAVEADEGAVFALAKNLIENAIDFSPRGGLVTVTLMPDAFEVEDQGPGIDPEHRDHVFERFWRAPQQQRQGAGLGLAICQEVANAHGWRICCEHKPTLGARFKVWFGDSSGTQSDLGRRKQA